MEYEERDTAEPENMAEAFRLSGMRVVPVLVSDGIVVTGYNPRRVAELFSQR